MFDYSSNALYMQYIQMRLRQDIVCKYVCVYGIVYLRKLYSNYEIKVRTKVVALLQGGTKYFGAKILHFECKLYISI